MENIAKILHISDLHFIPNITEKGRSLWANFAHVGPKSHAFGKVDAFSGRLQELELTGNHVDLVLATGDISTDGTEASLRTALEFVESNEIYRGSPQRLLTYGIGAGPTKRIIIPGNHDRYGGPWSPTQQPSMKLEEVFRTPTTYPYVVGFRRNEVRDKIEERAVIFFVFDSTASLEATAGEEMNRFHRIARGRLEDAECRWLVRQAAQISANMAVPTLDGSDIPVDYESSVRIAILHHHPIDGAGGGSDGFWTFMENSGAFVQACFEAGIDIVLFGHEHKSYYELRRPAATLTRTVTRQDTHPIHFFCCPSTFEYHTNKNGFYIFDFYSNEFLVDSYQWDGGSFVVTTAPPYSYHRNIPPGRSTGAAAGR